MFVNQLVDITSFSVWLNTTLAGYNPDLDGLDEDIVKETLWKSVVYRLSNKVQTFKKLGGIPPVEEYKSFQKGFMRLFELGSKSNDPRDKPLRRVINITVPGYSLKAWMWFGAL